QHLPVGSDGSVRARNEQFQNCPSTATRRLRGDCVSCHAAQLARWVAAASHPGRVRQYHFGPSDQTRGPGRTQKPGRVAGCQPGAEFVSAGHGRLITRGGSVVQKIQTCRDRKSTRLNSSHVAISYAVFCLKKKTTPAQPTSS